MTYAEKFNTSSTCANSEGIKRSITVSTHRGEENENNLPEIQGELYPV